ncbi:hypothetical protein H7X46_25970 [Pseudonocardia sp. C8]|uniref:hypothetical protein n=1 Tax=Pseudonocardia sp. C8 TaxID=2762759 RepID=UPI0016433029|nr:hypothetical protein [Pseudonocardia sp. C8]MBC3194501.1 hypothetical protein [Pseudonocardia sp. C8]
MTRGPRRHIEKALGAMTRSADPLEVLDAARQLREAAEQIEWESARDARAAGVTWSRIGALYGTSKQAVQQRFGRLPGPRSTPARTDPPANG